LSLYKYVWGMGVGDKRPQAKNKYPYSLTRGGVGAERP